MTQLAFGDVPTLASIAADIKSTAVFAEQYRYRYLLERVWDESAGLVNFVMFNPSSADQYRDDPTLSRCVRFTFRWGMGGLIVTNFYAHRSSNPQVITYGRVPSVDAIGPLNETYIVDAARRARIIICAWGALGAFEDRDLQVYPILNEIAPGKLFCLGTTKEGHPKHPMARGRHRIPDDQQPIPFSIRRAA